MYDKKREGAVRAFKAHAGQGKIELTRSRGSHIFQERGSGSLDLSSFTDISVNPNEKTAYVEGSARYYELVKATLVYGLIPSVVPEFRGLKPAGVVSGTGIEAQSYLKGIPSDTVLEMDILTGTGEVITASPENKYRDLFYGVTNAYGTLGYILRMKIQLMPIKPYVELTHRGYKNSAQYFADLERLSSTYRRAYDLDGELHFLDGTVFARDTLIITDARPVETAPFVSDYHGDEPYYRSIEPGRIDYLTIHDYLWRWDADAFWTSKKFGAENFLVRKLYRSLGLLRTDFYLTSMHRYHRLLNSRLGFLLPNFEKGKESILQDVAIPIEHASEFLEFVQREIGISPIWICPVQNQNIFPLFSVMEPGKLYVDIAFWDSIPAVETPDKRNLLIEDTARELGGAITLYARPLYPNEETFYRTYDSEGVYDTLKQKYDPHSVFPRLYEKRVRR